VERLFLFALRRSFDVVAGVCVALLAVCVSCTSRDSARAGVRASEATVSSHGSVVTSVLGNAPVVDDYGDTIPRGLHPTRIVSLNPTTTETLFAMGESARLIGRSHWDAWPDSALRVPDLGNALRPNVEAIIAARPDLVILYASADNRAAAQRLRQAGVATLSFKIDQIETFDHATRIIGRVLGDSARGDAVADSVRHTLDRVRDATRGLNHPTVIWPFAYRPVMVVGGGSFMTQLLDIAGARNIYAELHDPSPVVTLEDVVRRNPYYLIRSVDREQAVTQPRTIDPAWQAVPAVREGRVVTAPAELVARPSVRLGEAAITLARLLHPGLDIR
jgi:ABC-type Fe3+-hydroxamate transport system substrate-binding protein